MNKYYIASKVIKNKKQYYSGYIMFLNGDLLLFEKKIDDAKRFKFKKDLEEELKSVGMKLSEITIEKIQENNEQERSE